MREVDQPQHAIDHGVAERDQRVDGADGERVDKLLQEKADHRRDGAEGRGRGARPSRRAGLGSREVEDELAVDDLVEEHRRLLELALVVELDRARQALALGLLQLLDDASRG